MAGLPVIGDDTVRLQHRIDLVETGRFHVDDEFRVRVSAPTDRARAARRPCRRRSRAHHRRPRRSGRRRRRSRARAPRPPASPPRPSRAACAGLRGWDCISGNSSRASYPSARRRRRCRSSASGANAPAVPLPHAATTRMRTRELVPLGHLLEIGLAHILDARIAAARPRLRARLEHDLLQAIDFVGTEGERALRRPSSRRSSRSRCGSRSPSPRTGASSANCAK